jgi:hypothetical protein
VGYSVPARLIGQELKAEVYERVGGEFINRAIEERTRRLVEPND